jgi:hypothetical protein
MFPCEHDPNGLWVLSADINVICTWGPVRVFSLVYSALIGLGLPLVWIIVLKRWQKLW